MAKRLRAGTVWINCHNVFDASLPFGGYKQSGWGREMGEQVLHNYTESGGDSSLGSQQLCAAAEFPQAPPPNFSTGAGSIRARRIPLVEESDHRGLES
jgi:hypothetical protein